MDITSIIYNNHKWKQLTKPVIKCLKNKDRMAVLVNFQSIVNPSLRVWILAAHFGHNENYEFDPTELTTIQYFLKDYVNEEDNFIIMADTNAAGFSGNESNKNILRTILNNPKSQVYGTKTFNSCCYNDHTTIKDGSKKWTPFLFKSDRIIANFGIMKTLNTDLSMDAPSQKKAQKWAKSINLPSSCYIGNCSNSPAIGEMHKPVLAELTLSENFEFIGV